MTRELLQLVDFTLGSPASPSLARREMPSRPVTRRDSGSRFTT